MGGVRGGPKPATRKLNSFPARVLPQLKGRNLCRKGCGGIVCVARRKKGGGGQGAAG